MKRDFLFHFGDALKYYAAPRKTLVLVLSTMRSGSTLLKALLGQAADVSHLQETRFHQLRTNRFDFYNHFCRLDEARIIVLKHPVWFSDALGTFEIPLLPSIRVISLVRDCQPTVLSLRKMKDNQQRSDDELIAYWCKYTNQILTKHDESGQRGVLIRYEDLVGVLAPIRNQFIVAALLVIFHFSQ